MYLPNLYLKPLNLSYDELYESVMLKTNTQHTYQSSKECLSRSQNTAHICNCFGSRYVNWRRLIAGQGTLNQVVVQIAQWCPTVASAVFSFPFSLLDSFKSQEGFMLYVRVNARKLVCESIHTFFFSLIDILLFTLKADRGKNEKRAKSVGSFDTAH